MLTKNHMDNNKEIEMEAELMLGVYRFIGIRLKNYPYHFQVDVRYQQLVIQGVCDDNVSLYMLAVSILGLYWQHGLKKDSQVLILTIHR